MIGKSNIPRRKKYLDHIKKQGCTVRRECVGDIAAHHMETGGMGIKCSDFKTLPLCMRHHAELHSIGRRSFVRKYDIDEYFEMSRKLENFILTTMREVLD